MKDCYRSPLRVVWVLTVLAALFASLLGAGLVPAAQAQATTGEIVPESHELLKATASDVRINEIRIDQPGTDLDEYFELAGPPGASLDGYTYLVIGDGTGVSGVVEAVVSLAEQVIAPDGYFLVAETTFTLGDADFEVGVSGLNFENSDNVTHLLVQDFTGASGNDLDTNDDGIFDVTPWTALVDLIALIMEDNPPLTTEYHYGPPTVGPEGTYVPGHVFFCGDQWAIGQFDPLIGQDTPGEANTFCPPPLDIHDIQGAAHLSPWVDMPVLDVDGIVTVVRSNGFYMQDAEPDDDDATSEGIFVYTRSAPGVFVGDIVVVDGYATEFYSGGYATGNLPITEISSSPSQVTVLSTGNPLPAATIIGAGGRVPPNTIINDDSATGDVETDNVFDPAEDGIDFYESLEGMLVAVENAQAVSPTNAYGEIAVVANGGASAGPMTARGGLLLQPDDPNPERIIMDDVIITAEPEVKVGDILAGTTTGVLDYSFGNFKFLNVDALTVGPGGLQPETTGITHKAEELLVATYNVLNLDPSDTTFDVLAQHILVNLNAPDIIALQEIQDDTGETDDGITSADQTYLALANAIAAAGGPPYAYTDIAPEDNQDGGAPGSNIRVGFLYRTGHGLTLVDRPKGDATTAVTVTKTSTGVELSLNPGRIEPTNDAFLDSRKPLVAEFLFNGAKVFVINNHLNSKGGDDGLFERYQPPVLYSEAQRLAQAAVVNNFVDSILALDRGANAVVLGDMNDFQWSPPLETLEGGVLNNLIYTLDQDQRYTYIYDGNSQALDHILVSDNLYQETNIQYDIVHVNAEFPQSMRASDHDPALAKMTIQAPALAISKTVTPSIVIPLGGTLTYTISLANEGDGLAYGITVTDTLPEEVAFGGWVQQDGAAYADGVLTWTGDLPANTSHTFVFTATLGSDPELVGTRVENAAEFTSANAGSGSASTAFHVQIIDINLPLIFEEFETGSEAPSGQRNQAFTALPIIEEKRVWK